MKKKLLFITLLIASANVRSITFDPGYTTPASPELTVTQLEPPTTSTGTSVSEPTPNCTLAVLLSDPDGSGNSYYYTSPKYPYTVSGGRRYCHGVELNGRTAVANYQILAAAFEGERLALRSTSMPSTQKCYWIIYLTSTIAMGGGSTGAIPCDSRPTSKSCIITVDDVIFHPNATGGRVKSIARGDARIHCTGAVSVRLSTNGTGVRLYSGTTAIESALYLNNDGQTEWNGKVDNTAKIDLISSIDEYTVAAGEYIGSTVLTASWD